MSRQTSKDTEGGPRRARLADVAEAAGVSTATVSKVLNGRPDVAAPTRERVERLLASSGYARRSTAEMAADPTLEMVFHELSGEWSAELVPAVEQACRAAGVSLVVAESGDLHSPGSAWIAGVLRRRPIGIILIFSDLGPAEQRKLLSRGINFVVVDPAGEPGPEVPSVGSTNWAGGLAAAEHLIELGHRRIAMISGPDDMLCSRARVDGYRSALDRAGVPFEPALLYTGDFLLEGGRAGAEHLLSLPAPPTAIFAGSDMQAIGVYEAARARSLRVPDDLSVVGYDDLHVARWTGPPLTTVRQPLAEMAQTAARQLIRMSRDREAPINRRIELATSLIVRESTARRVP